MRRVVTSEVLLRELARVLRGNMALSAAATEHVLSVVHSLCAVVAPREQVRVITRKDDDNRVLECAAAAGADAIISGDTRDLLPLGDFRGIRILSPRAALEQLKEP